MIEINNLSYFYKVKKTNNILSLKKDKILALNNINLNIADFDQHAIVGFNGAGKSTLIKLLIGILKPSYGEIYVNNISPWRNRVEHVKNIGVVWGQRSTLWWDLPVIDSFKALQKIYKINNKSFNDKLDFLDSILNLHLYWNQPVRKLSLGQRVKAEITSALLHSPKLLILDEPFLGLDFISRRLILDVLKEMIKNQKITLILTSHDLDDISELCKNITILEKGQIKFSGSINEIKRNNNLFSEIIIEKNDLTPLKLSDSILKKNNVRINQDNNNISKYIITFQKYNVDIKDIIINIFENNKGIVDISIQEESLEKSLSKFFIK